ncbi:vacuolar membrane-associated protein iml1, partial [Pichia californica]
PFGGLGATAKTDSPFGGLGTTTKTGSSFLSSAPSKPIITPTDSTKEKSSIFGSDKTPNPFGSNSASPFGNNTSSSSPLPLFGNASTTSSSKLFTKPSESTSAPKLFDTVTAKIEEINEINSTPTSAEASNTHKSKPNAETALKIEELESEYEEEEEQQEEEEEIEEINKFEAVPDEDESDFDDESFEEISSQEFESDVDLGLDRNPPMLFPKEQSLKIQPSSHSIQTSNNTASVKFGTTASTDANHRSASTSTSKIKKEFYPPVFIKKEQNIPLDEHCNDYDFELNSKINSDDAIKNIILNNNIKFDGVSQSYKEFIESKKKFYDEIIENIPKLVEKWDEDRIAETSAKYKAKLESAKSERLIRLKELFHKNEERDSELIKFQEEANRRSKMLNAEIEKRKEEIRLLKEEHDLEDEIDKKFQQELIEANIAMKLMKDEVDELHDLVKEQEDLIAKDSLKNSRLNADEKLAQDAKNEIDRIAVELTSASSASESDVDQFDDDDDEEEEAESEAEANTTFLGDEAGNENDIDNDNIVEINSDDIEEAEKEANEIGTESDKTDITPKEVVNHADADILRLSKTVGPKNEDLETLTVSTDIYITEIMATDDILDAEERGVPIEDDEELGDGIISHKFDKFGMIITTASTMSSTVNVNIKYTSADFTGVDSKIIDVEDEVNIPAVVISSIEAEDEDDPEASMKETEQSNDFEISKEKPKNILSSQFADDSSDSSDYESVDPAEPVQSSTLSNFKPSDKEGNYVTSSTTTAPERVLNNYSITESTATGNDFYEVVHTNTDNYGQMTLTTSTEMVEKNVVVDDEKVLASTTTNDNFVIVTNGAFTTYEIKEASIEPNYINLNTELDEMKIGVVSNFEEDEVYFSKHYIPLALPLMHALGKVEYPNDFEKLSPIGKQMKKLIYDVFIDFDVLHKNVNSMNKYMTDQSNDSIIYHTLENSSGFANFWRFFEIGTVLLGAERQATVFSDLASYYKDLERNSSTLRSDIFSDLKKLSSYEESLDQISKKNLQYQKSYLDSKRPLSFDNVKTRRALREKVQKLQDIDRTVQSEVLILKSQLYPEEVVKDDRAMNSVISSLQRNLYGHAEIISGLSNTMEKIKEAEQKPNKITSGTIEDDLENTISIPDVAKIPGGRLAHLAVRATAHKSLADVLRNKKNMNSQRTNEATLVVGRKNGDDAISANNNDSNKDQINKKNDDKKNKKLLLNFGKQKDDIFNEKSSPETNTHNNNDSNNNNNNNTLPTKNDKELNSSNNYKSVTLTVKFHEIRTSLDTVLVDPKLVPGAKVGDIGEIQCLYGSKKKFFFKFKEFKRDPLSSTSNSKSISMDKSPIFEDKILHDNMNNTDGSINNNDSLNNIISILSGPIVTTLDLKPRCQVTVRVRTKESVQADTIEIYIKDIHLSRGDMWNISGLLANKCIYKNEKLSFINGSIRLSVNKIYKNGHKFFSSYVGKDTKIVFRSDSARLIVFIQISSEMWHFEESGQQMFHKLVNSFFPKAFQKWKDLGTHHLITIILFSSVDLEGEKIRYAEGETPPNKTDYYRVVVDQVHILLWNEIMATLRLEFANFKRDIYLHKNKHIDEKHPQEYLIQGSVLSSVKGSVLEAINLGMSLVCDDFRDSYLRQTTNHFIMISPGTGLFDVSYDMLIRTSKLISTVDSTVDIICLSQPPLHIVPLVRYLDNQNRLKHCIPNWLDISFWSDSSQAVHQWLPKCKIYDLQMMGVMENELTAVAINDLDLSTYKSAIDAMNSYDDDVFNTSYVKREKKNLSRGKKPLKGIRDNNNQRKTVTMTNNQNRIIVGTTDDGLKPAELKLENNKSTPATSNVVGTSTTSKSNVSAFSSLLSLSKNTDIKTPTSSAYNFVRKMISTPILKPSENDNKDNNSNTYKNLQNIEHLTLNESSNSIDFINRNNYTPDSTRSSKSSISIGMNKNSSNINSISDQNLIVRSKKNYSRNTRNNKSSKNDNKNNDNNSNDNITNNYWTDIENPSNTIASKLLSLLSYGRWRFVFPPDIKRRNVKWISLSSPASLPVFTSIFPTLNDFNQNYTFRIYDVLLNQDIINENQTSITLMRNMISLRLSLGFQICIGDNVEKIEKHRKPNGDNKLLIEFLNNGEYIGSRCYLSMGNEIHRICCDFNGLLNVQVYKRISSNDEQLSLLNNNKEYIEYIRTRYSEIYLPVKITNSRSENSRNYNWNQLDQVLAGYKESIDKQRYHRMKFVILPANVPENAFSLNNEKLSTEEIRLEGIRSLIMNIYKIRFRTNEEKKINKRLEISPEIYFYTGSLFKYLKNESNNIKKLKDDNLFIPDSILSTNKKEEFINKNQQYNKLIDSYILVSILKSRYGIPIIDRYWHLKIYKNCFIGMDLVNFLVENFEDIETREEAVEYGNKLMLEKVFYHVISKHKFLDGHYFYYLDDKFMEEKKDNKNNKIRSDSINEIKDEVNKNDDNNYDVDDDDEKNKNQIQSVMLSKEVLCDLDPNEFSWQPELIKVHYDIVHNPDHCFHLRIEWLNTTSKLIEDLINGWSKYCERYGLSLVEIPWEELFTLPIRNPLHSTIEISLSINPWEDKEFKDLKEIFEKEKYYFHLYLLHKSSFMLDNRTANYFKDDLFDVNYSWGKPMFKYAQFIHSTGGYIAELRNNGDFFLAPNNAHISRLNLNIGKLHNLGKSKAIYFDSQSVMLEFRSICNNQDKLREIFREGVKLYKNDEYFI